MQGEDLRAYVDVFGEQAALTAPSASPRVVNALFSEPGADLLGGQVVADAAYIVALTSDLASCPRHTAVSVAGRNWRTREAAKPIEDGALAVVTLERMA